MNQPEQIHSPDLHSARYHALVERYGYLIGGDDLWRLLAYRSLDAFRKAQTLRTVPVRTFRIKGRRTRFASTEDVARWLDQQLAALQEGGPETI